MSDFVPEIKVFLLSMLPIGELRLALPLALLYYHLPVPAAFSLAILGNFLPMIFVVYFLDWADDKLAKRSPVIRRTLDWLYEHTRKKHTQTFEIWGALALIIFIAIPLPGTGAWTGALAAYVFGFEKRRTLAYIFLGILGAAGIVGAATLGLSRIL